MATSSGSSGIGASVEKRRYDRRDGIIYNDRVEADAYIGVILTQLARTSLLLHVRPSDLPSFGK
jgi:hypothetical protein